MATFHIYGAVNGRVRYVNTRDGAASPPLGARPALMEQFYLQEGGTAAAIWDAVPANVRRIPKSAWDRILWDGPIDLVAPSWWHYSVVNGNVVHVAWYEAANISFLQDSPLSFTLYNGGTSMRKHLAALPVAEGATVPGDSVASPSHKSAAIYFNPSFVPGVV